MKNAETEKRSKLTEALRKNELEMHMQFIVAPTEDKIIAAEALARWNCPKRGVLKPDAFVEEKEGRTEELLELDLFIFEKVCKKLARWHKRGWKDLSLSCNFSRHDFSDPALADKLIGIAGKYEFCRDRLVIEVVENDVEELRPVMSRILWQLKDFGFRVALDDFGAAGTSVKDFQILPLDILKLDRSLLRYSWSPSGERVFREIIEMGKRLRYFIVCEGVETESELQIAIRSGVHAVQGFLHYMPVPEHEADQFLEQYFTRPCPA